MAVDVQKYLQYREVCRELVECALLFRSGVNILLFCAESMIKYVGLDHFDWDSFGASAPPAYHHYAIQASMRPALAEIGCEMTNK